MRLITDFQIHSRYSRATSSSLNLANLEKYARIKGIDLLGTGDITHPTWLKEIENELTEDGSGILRSKGGFPFVLQGEISNIYTAYGKGRRVHNLILAPNIAVAKQIQAALSKKGRIDYDGRPIFGFSCPELIEMMRGIDTNIEVIPAHIWTPWFSLFGSMSGFDSVEECFQDQTKHIHALETGLSSDPPMNWRISSLDKYLLVSNSDAHSFWPWRIGREATIMDIKPTYKEFLAAIRTRKGFEATIEVDPCYGKYHLDGHRACNVCLTPTESKKLKNMCPKCGKPLAIGVLNRVEQLADRPEGYKPTNAQEFYSLLPLSEIIAAVLGVSVTSKKVGEVYDTLITQYGSEFKILLEVSAEAMNKHTKPEIAAAVTAVRERTIEITPGYDGEYGRLVLDKISKTSSKTKSTKQFQKKL